MAISDTRKRFNAMFREARNRGDGVFEFEGKRYTTELAKPKAKQEAAPTVKLDAEKLATGKDGSYDPDLANKIAIAKQADYDRQSQEGRFGSMKKGGKVKKMAAGGSASKRADGCAVRGKTRGKMV